MVKITDVAVAVFVKPGGSFLLSSRPDGKPYAGYWEFPGGKIEPGESVRDALRREMIEELNVVIDECAPWFTFMMHYEHATVRLHTWRVTAWHDADAGLPNARGMYGLEGQQFAWQTSVAALNVSPTLPGCAPIFRALSLPTRYVVTNATEVGVDAYLQYLRAFSAKSSRNSPSNGEFAIQVREKAMPPFAFAAFAREVITVARECGAMVFINADVALAQSLGADGVQLPSSQLATLSTRPDLPWVGASVHTHDELLHAAEIKCDFAVLGSVKATQSHPNRPPLGWPAFAALALSSSIPVFAIGGMLPGDITEAQQHGAHGIAMQRQAFAD
ncbi:MAG: Nudix family hydrolase [Rhodocyclaceae bacterium]|jgi:8-oxo-dGTP diphosphatase|nr:Nudix family hydrolase [Rhodocyclaceae bacterium]